MNAGLRRQPINKRSRAFDSFTTPTIPSLPPNFQGDYFLIFSGVMGVRGGVFVLLVLVISCSCVGARNLVTSDVSVMQINSEIKDKRVCSLCEQFTTQAVTYLNQNKTQTEIIDHLHVACSRLLSFKQECLTLVDYYAPLFFLEVTTIQPGDFCEKMNLCDEQFPPNSCKLCHAAVEEVMAKLEDPDTQLEIIEVLLKVCNADKHYAKKCKKLVFEFGPLALANAEQFLASRDLCTTIHACNGSDEASSLKRAFLSDS